MTTSRLYALYAAAHAYAAHLFANGCPAHEIELRTRPDLSALAKVMADLAILDATNGTPLRSRASFERLLDGGSPMLRRLELRERAERSRGQGTTRWAASPETTPSAAPAATSRG